jgi:TIR domain/SIR2-like domain
MTVFISYARTDAPVVTRLAADLRGMEYTVWYDTNLVGGDDWWHEILRHIAECELFVAAISPRSLKSRACKLELDWARTTGRAVLPVLVGRVEQDSDGGLDLTQTVSYLQRGPDVAHRLAVASAKLAGSGTPPLAAPTPPEAPMPALAPLAARIRTETLPVEEQQAILGELLRRADDVDQASSVRRLAQLLAQRQDQVVVTVHAELSTLLRRLPAEVDDDVTLFGASEEDESAGRDGVHSIVTQLTRHKCTPVLGLGVTEALVGGARRLAREWGDHVDFALADYLRADLSQVAQFVRVINDRPTLTSGFRDHLTQAVRDRHPNLELPDPAPEIDELLQIVWNTYGCNADNDPHAVMAKLPCAIYVSAHPSDLLAHALRTAGRDPVVEVCRWRSGVYDWPVSIWEAEPGYEPTFERPLVYHPFGHLATPDSLVITQDEGFDFLIAVTRERELVPLVVREALADSALLLLGFDLDDNDIGLIMRTLFNAQALGRAQSQDYTHLAVQAGIAEVAIPSRAKHYLEKYFRSVQKPPIEIFWGTLDTFLGELQHQLAVAPGQRP